MRPLLFVPFALAFAACDSAARPVPAVVTSTSAEVRSGELFPLVPGATWTYEGEADGQSLREEVIVLKPIVWKGLVDAVAIVPRLERRFFDGELEELTTEWFREAPDGGIWQYGEETWALDDGSFVRGPDSWFAGEDGALPVQVLPALARAGEAFTLQLPRGTEQLLVRDIDTSAETPAGLFTQCTEVVENEDTPDEDIVLYAPGQGIVSRTSRTSRSVLVRSQPPR
ncbi:MAG: hypothetical protein KDC98_16655 [Planctomycetes bacterium]|nr:hypothetical protein [Planctomycetota bacterium]